MRPNTTLCSHRMAPWASTRLAATLRGAALACLLVPTLLAGSAPARVGTVPVHAAHIGPAVEEIYLADDARIEGAITALGEQDVEFVDVDVCVDPERFRISAAAKLTIATEEPVVELALNEDLAVLSVTGGGRQLQFLRDGAALVVRTGPLGRPIVELTVRYEGTLTPGDHVRLQKRLVFLGDSSHWYPSPRYGDRCRFRTVVRYPQGYTSVCTGALAGMTPSSSDSASDCGLGDVWDTGVPVPSAAVAVGTFASSYSVWGDVFLGYHMLVEPDEGTPEGVEASATELKGLVSYLESCYGPYPFEWLSVVSIPGFPAGLPSSASAPGFVVVTDSDWSGTGLRMPRADRVVSGLSKSWWPHSIDAGSIVSEGLSALCEISLLVETGDEEGAARRREAARSRYIAALADSGGRAPLRDCLEGGGAVDMRICGTRSQAFFGILEEVVGRDAFCRALRGLGSRFAGGMLPLREVVAAFEVEDGRDLDWLVYEWIYRGDLPTYVLSYDVVPRGKEYVVKGTIGQLGEIFRTPIPLTIDLGVWSYDEWVAIDSPRQPFELATDLEPQSIGVDLGFIVPRIEAGELAGVHYERGQRAADANEWGAAVDEFGAASHLVPGEALYLRRYGGALVRSGRVDLGLAALEDAMKLLPDDADGRMSLAKLYLVSGRYKEAKRHLDEYVSRGKDDPEGYAVRAMALVALDRLPEAGQDVARAESLADTASTGENVMELLSLASGRLFEATGDTERALSAYREALRLNPVSDEARRGLARLAPGSE
ncbi:MAG: tetratricopeptide repeat protein [Candidatus Eisenbacteria bacterium]